MKRIFLEDVTAERITILGDDARHLAYSLRARRGDKITAVDSRGRCAVLELVDFDRNAINAQRISDIQEISVGRKIILADCLPKQNRFDNIVEKSTELGVTEIIPLISDRTIARPNEARENAKRERWERIAKETAEQCARDTIPEIGNIRDLDEWLKEISPLDEKNLFLLFCWEKEQTTTVREVLNAYKNSCTEKDLVVLIGPEGGFSDREVHAIKAAGGVSCSLGKRILKTDTAVICTLAMINYEFME